MAKDGDGSVAAREGHGEVVRVLLERGTDADSRDVQGSTPLRMALQGRHGKVARPLLGNGTDAEARDIMCLTDFGTYDNIN